MACEDCTLSAQQEHHGFTFGCTGCCARAAARTRIYRDTVTEGRKGAMYRWMLQQFGVTHAEVARAAAADKLQEQRA